MSYPYFKIPDDCHVQAQARVDYQVLNADASRARSYVYSDLSKQLAHFLVKAKTTEIDGNYSKTFRVELYVFNPDDFHRIVQEEAMRLSMYKPLTIGYPAT